MTEENVLISTDCVSDLTLEQKERYQIPVMHYYIHTEEARFQDTTEMTSDDLIEYIELDGKHAYSNCASVEEYRDFFEKLRKRTSAPIIHICMARYVSDAYDTASQAAADMEGIYVVDSGHLSGGMGLMVLAAADMAECGAVCEVILKELEELRERVSTSFIVDSTECLYRNGKIGRRIAFLCDFFSLHPVLKLKNSRMCVAGIFPGSQRHLVAKYYINKTLLKSGEVERGMAFLITAGCAYEFQQYLKEEIESRKEWDRLVLNEASATISCNCGSGAFGLLFVKREK